MKVAQTELTSFFSILKEIKQNVIPQDLVIFTEEILY